MVVDKLPGNEELCQLCYYADENNGVLGLSTPFKLEHYSEERLLEFIDRQDYAALLNTFEVCFNFYLPKSLFYVTFQ